MWKSLQRHDWLTDLWIASIPFQLLWIGVVAVVSVINDYLNPPFIRAQFASIFTRPEWKLIGGFIPIYKPFSKWDKET